MTVIDGKIHVDTAGSGGNVFAVISLADSIASQMAYSKEKRKQLQECLMRSTQYESILCALLDEFPNLIVFNGFEDKRAKPIAHQVEPQQWF